MPDALWREITRTQFVERFRPRFPTMVQPDHPAFRIKLARRQVWSFLYHFPGQKFYVSGMMLGDPRVIGYVYCDIPYEDNMRYRTQMFDTEEETDLHYWSDPFNAGDDADETLDTQDDTDDSEDLIED
jgi:hypothetical protein